MGTPAYIAPEVLSRREYDGKVIDSVSYMELDSEYVGMVQHTGTSLCQKKVKNKMDVNNFKW